MNNLEMQLNNIWNGEYVEYLEGDIQGFIHEDEEYFYLLLNDLILSLRKDNRCLSNNIGILKIGCITEMGYKFTQEMYDSCVKNNSIVNVHILLNREYNQSEWEFIHMEGRG